MFKIGFIQGSSGPPPDQTPDAFTPVDVTENSTATVYTYYEQQVTGTDTSFNLLVALTYMNAGNVQPILYYRKSAVQLSLTADPPSTQSFNTIANNTQITIDPGDWLYFGVEGNGDTGQMEVTLFNMATSTLEALFLATARSPDVVPAAITVADVYWNEGAGDWNFSTLQITNIIGTIDLYLDPSGVFSGPFYYKIDTLPFGDPAPSYTYPQYPPTEFFTLWDGSTPLTVSNNDYVTFACEYQGGGGSLTVDLINGSDSNTILDTFNIDYIP